MIKILKDFGIQLIYCRGILRFFGRRLKIRGILEFRKEATSANSLYPRKLSLLIAKCCCRGNWR